MEANRLKEIELQEKIKIRFMLGYALAIIAYGLLIGSLQESFQGLWRIIITPTYLLTDYFAVGGLGAGFLNSGLVMLIAILIARRSDSLFNGALLASIFTMGGFAFFGKNIYNILSIILGVYLFSRWRGDSFSKYIIIGFFGTGLAPVISLIHFGLPLPALSALLLGKFIGILLGLILPPLAISFISFHKGFNLYNIGFTSGVIGMLIMAILSALGHRANHQVSVSEQGDSRTVIFLFLYFISMSVIGFLGREESMKNYLQLLRYHGRLVSDFVVLRNFPMVLFNMGLLGTIAVSLVLVSGGSFSGPVLGGIFTLVGFGAFGKHPKNILPVMLGVTCCALLMHVKLSETKFLVTVLFSTTLAPVAGYYGFIPGFIVGAMHWILVGNLSFLHGGLNLYNNGFAGGFIAAVAVPLLQTIKGEDD